MSKFQAINFYKAKKRDYQLLPFRFENIDENLVFLSNIAGEYALIKRTELMALVEHSMSSDEPTYRELRLKSFISDDKTKISETLLPIKIRSRLRALPEFTGLHMFVVTLRCEHSCPYCQVSRQSEDTSSYDMTEEIAERAISLAFKSPSQHLKFEFQGGEPLLNFDLIKFIIVRALEIKPPEKTLDFVIATNLALLTDDILQFCREHGVSLSTSLDGPKDLHNLNRPRPNGDSYERTISGIKRARDSLGSDSVSALMTTTAASLERARDIVDEYLAQGFKGIFLRALSPHGFAIKTKAYSRYRVNKWLDFYKEALDYILHINKEGTLFTEYFTQTIVRKMISFDNGGYVDLMSPAGIGIAAVSYNYDGDVYCSDEGRMRAETGDKSFSIGNVLRDSYDDIFFSNKLLDPIEESFAKSVPGCEQCAFEDYCGSDPVYHFSTQGDWIGKKPTSEFCIRNLEIFKHIVRLMNDSKDVENIFRKWALKC